MPAKGQKLPLETRFWRYVKRGPKRECWLWFGDKVRDDYGRILVYHERFVKGHGTCAAHRVSYELFVGPIPAGLSVLHKCDTPACVNPHHLKLGTHIDNMADRRERGRSKGELQHNAKLTNADVRAIRRDTRYQYVIAKEYGVIQATISKIKLGKTWTHVK